MASERPHVPELGNDVRAKTLLDVQIEAIGVRGAEVVIHGKEVDDARACDRFGQWGEDELSRSPDIYARQGVGAGHRVNAGGVVLHAVGSTILCAAQIEKWDHVRRVKEHAETAANHGVGETRGLIGKTNTRA